MTIRKHAKKRITEAEYKKKCVSADINRIIIGSALLGVGTTVRSKAQSFGLKLAGTTASAVGESLVVASSLNLISNSIADKVVEK